MRGEERPNIFIRILMRYLIEKFKKSGSHKFMAWGVKDRKNDIYYRFEIGIDENFTLLNGRERAIEELATTIYLADKSDYRYGLMNALYHLSPSIYEKVKNDEWEPTDG